MPEARNQRMSCGCTVLPISTPRWSLGRDGSRQSSCYERLKPGGSYVMTTPPPSGRARATPSRCISWPVVRQVEAAGFVLTRKAPCSRTRTIASIGFRSPIKGETDPFAYRFMKA
jgi:predicted methyltransferase